MAIIRDIIGNMTIIKEVKNNLKGTTDQGMKNMIDIKKNQGVTMIEDMMIGGIDMIGVKKIDMIIVPGTEVIGKLLQE